MFFRAAPLQIRDAALCVVYKCTSNGITTMVDWSSAALVFPGQGSQQVGMGKDLAQQYPAAAQVFEQADQVLGFSFTKLCFEGPAEQLDETINTQPALYVTGVATLRAIEAQLGSIKPLATAGHSLGELTALTAAGALPFEAGLKLVRERGRLMKEAGEKNPGAIAAVLGVWVADSPTTCEPRDRQPRKTPPLAQTKS